MNFAVQNYNTNLNINFRNTKNFSKKTVRKLMEDKDFFPEVSLYNTGIKDFRLKSLVVEKRERMIQQSPLPSEYIYVDGCGITRLKPHLFIKHIVVKPEYLRQGVWRETINKIVNLSKEEGYEGRVLLFSAPIRGTENYISNPAIAHWANGFRFYDSNCVKQMLEVLSGTSPAENAPGGCMYYPVI